MRCLALTYLNQSRFDDAKALLIEVVEERKQEFGKDHLLTLQRMQELAKTYRSQECWTQNEASELSFEAFKANKCIFREDYASTLFSIRKLAFTYVKQRFLDDARELFAKVVDARKKVLGNSPKHALPL